MKHYFITGSSSGLGKAISEAVMSDSKVFGYARHCTIDHPNYTHQNIDLSLVRASGKMLLELPEQSDGVVLINNAGTIGEIRRTGDLAENHYEEVFRLNLIVLAQICDRFLSQARRKNYPCLIINISSGAAVNPIPSWAAYCASKAGVDMFTRVVHSEIQELKLDHIRIFSLYPGIIDTPMQAHIRGSKEDDFSSVVRFREYKEGNSLYSPAQVTDAILRIFKDPERLTDVVVNIRDYIQ